MSSCSEGNVTVVSDVNNSSLQLVEMCSSEGVWSPVCDNNWTLQDATVVCRELDYQGFTHALNINSMVYNSYIACNIVFRYFSVTQNPLQFCYRE